MKTKNLLESSTEHSLAKALGFVSLAIGATELLMPRQLEKTMGIGNGQTTGILRILGIRECLHGFDLLAHENTKKGLLARCAGDMLDGALLAAAGVRTRKPSGFAMICAAVLPVVLLDMYLAARQTTATRAMAPSVRQMRKTQRKMVSKVASRF